MSAVSTKRVGTAELVGRARDLKGLIAANAAENEECRRIADTSIEALEEAGLLRLMTPARLGGSEVGLRTKMEVESMIAEADGSTAWVTNLINACNWLASLLPDDAQQEIFGADPNAKVAGVLAPTSETKAEAGGIRVTGRWSWASGSLHATWALGGVPILDEAGNVVDRALVFMPMSELDVEETWFVAGMQGTGSNTILAEDVFVPYHRVLSISEALKGKYPTEHKDEAIYRSAFLPLLALTLVGPLLGLGRAACDLVIEKAPRRAVTYTKFERQSDSAAFQIALSEASMRVDSAYLHAFRAADDIDSYAAEGANMEYLTRARVRADAGYVSTMIVSAIQILLDAHGASSFAQASPMQRIWRDANTGGRHAIVNPLIAGEIYGKALVGVPPEEQITELI